MTDKNRWMEGASDADKKRRGLYTGAQICKRKR